MLIIVFAEYRGKRFLIDRFQSRFVEAEKLAAAWKEAHPAASFYISDKSPSHYHFDGGASDLFDEEKLAAQ